MKRSLLCAGMLLTMMAAHAQQTVMLEDDMGCDAVDVQKTRVRLTRVVMTTDNEQAKDQATRELNEVTRQHCVPLSGIFTVKEKRSGLLKVINKDGAELWLVE